MTTLRQEHSKPNCLSKQFCNLVIFEKIKLRMPENMKVPRSASPVARCGAGDISERELSRERHNLQTTPPARFQPAHPKKKLFFTPVSKFTAKPRTPTPHLARIRSCLEDFRALGEKREMSPKAASMEDLTPTKRMRKDDPKTDKTVAIRSPKGIHGVAQQEAAARVARFMVVAAWRRRRDDVRCLRRTLEFQVSCSERLRIQVSALKSLLDSDNAKVRLAMKELDRLKQLLRDKDMEKSVLQREKLALENDVCAAEDRASEMSIGWRNSRNELEASKTHIAALERAVRHERTAATALRAERDRLGHELSVIKEQLGRQESLRASCEAASSALRAERDAARRHLARAVHALSNERASRESCERECEELNKQLSCSCERAAQLEGQCTSQQELLQALEMQLQQAREQLDWWPKPITRLAAWARSSGLRAALVWAAAPACSHLPRTWIN